MLRKTARIVGCLGVVGFLGGGCGIDEGVHKKTLADLAACQNQSGACSKDLAAAQDRLNALDENLENVQSEEQRAKNQLASAQRDLQASEEELAELRKQREAAEKRLASFKKLNERLAKLVDTGKLKVAFRNGQMVLELPAEILFPSGRAKLSKRGKEALGEVAQILLEFKDRRFMIAGHTDNQKIRTKKFPNNWHLSTARSVSVLEVLDHPGL